MCPEADHLFVRNKQDSLFFYTLFVLAMKGNAGQMPPIELFEADIINKVIRKRKVRELFLLLVQPNDTGCQQDSKIDLSTLVTDSWQSFDIDP